MDYKVPQVSTDSSLSHFISQWSLSQREQFEDKKYSTYKLSEEENNVFYSFII